MGYLEQFVRIKKGKGKNVTTTVKLPEETFYTLRNYCDNLGITLTEAIYLLVERELKEAGSNNIQQHTKYKEINHEIAATIQPNTEYEEEHTPHIQQNTTKRSSSTSSSIRFNTTEYVINEELPCPICEKWVSRGNYSRHAKGHDLTTQEIFELHQDKTKEMVQHRKEALSM